MKVEREFRAGSGTADPTPDPGGSLRPQLLDAYARRDASGRDARSFFGFEDRAHLLRVQQRQRWVLSELARRGVSSFSERSILDLGCGDGDGVVDAVRWGADPARIVGVDLRPDALAKARDRVPTAHWVEACATALPFDEGQFDLVFLSTVLSSVVDPAARLAVAAEAERTVATDGHIVVYDMVRTNPKNADVVPIDRAELTRLFPRRTGTVRRLTFAPHWARRWPAGLLEWAYPCLASIPMLCSHQAAVLGPRVGER